MNSAAHGSPIEVPTPGARNAPPHRPDVVFSELYFEPLNDDPNDEFVEIHNRSSQIVHLGDWRIDGGITFQFPPGTFLEPGKFLAISRNLTRLRELYPDLAPTPVVGNFDGSLRNRGERLTLLRSVVVDPTPGPIPHVRYLAVEDDLTYVAGARVNLLAAGGSSSLERIDFEAPSSDPNLWRDSDESGRASWTSVESSGALTLTHPGVPSADQLQTLMLGPGEALVDDVEVLVNGNNWIANGRFETGTNGWVFQGTHRSSRVDPGAGPDGSRALHLVASDRGDHVANRIRTVLTSPIPVSAITTLRAKLRWLKAHPEILFRLRNGGLEAVGRLREPQCEELLSLQTAPGSMVNLLLGFRRRVGCLQQSSNRRTVRCRRSINRPDVPDPGHRPQRLRPRQPWRRGFQFHQSIRSRAIPTIGLNSTTQAPLNSTFPGTH